MPMPNIKLGVPNITGKTDKERLDQMERYLYYLVSELQWAFENQTITPKEENKNV